MKNFEAIKKYLENLPIFHSDALDANDQKCAKIGTEIIGSLICDDEKGNVCVDAADVEEDKADLFVVYVRLKLPKDDEDNPNRCVAEFRTLKQAEAFTNMLNNILSLS